MPATPPDSRPASSAAFRAALLALLALTGTGCEDNETAIARGDRLWADSNFTSALNEYRLAAAQRDDDEALSRLAHAFARTGSVEGAIQTYQRLVERSDRFRDQAAYDLLALAERALARRDRFTAAEALGGALIFRRELAAPTAARVVGEFYQDRDRPAEALEYYRRALTGLPPDSAAALLYRMGRLEGERGRCATAIDFFRAFREQVSEEGRQWVSLLGEARWHTGSCAFRLASEAREAGDVGVALDHLGTVLRLGVPENLLDQAWFDRGELLFGMGAYDEALASYRRVLERNPTRAGRLVERARARIDQIRFGGLPADTGGAGPVPLDSGRDTG